MTTPKEFTSSSYSVFSFVLDDARGQTLPVGVALWSPERHFARFRLVQQNERLKGFRTTKHFPLVRLVSDKLARWIDAGNLPYQDEPMLPFHDRWWRHVRDLLIHRVRISEPRPIDCRDPENELDALFESVVAPCRSRRESTTRIDGVIRKCLQELARKFKGRKELPGYGQRKVRVQRAYHGAAGWVVIEGVNLAGPGAETQADATVSRLMRLREGVNEKCQVMIGYLASPEGLNGERVLVEWMRERTDAKTFDLLKDREDFRETARRMVEDADGQRSLFE